MSLKSNNTAIALVLQSQRGAFNAPNSNTDLFAGVANLRPTINGITIADDSYTGSVFRNADQIAGKNFTATFDVKLKGPGALPAANAMILGRLLQMAKFTELRNAAAIPVSPEAIGVGSDETHVVLGATGSSTDDLYRGLPVKLSDNGATTKQQMSAIRDYVGSTKTAELMEELDAPPAANWQIPPYMAYVRDTSSAEPPVGSMRLWMGGLRFDLLDVGVTGMRLVFPTSTTQQAQYPRLEVTIEATIYATADEVTPAIPALGPVPLLKDADVMLDRKRVGTADVTFDFGLTSERPPNPNQLDGSDAPEITGGTAVANITQQKYLKSELDTLAMADAQGYYPFWMQYGNGPGSLIQVTVPDARLNFPNIDLSGGNINEQLSLFIDVGNRNFVLAFIYP